MLANTQLLYTYRRIIWATTLSDIRGRFSGTVFGVLWAMVYPAMFLGLYAVVYTTIFQVKLKGYTDFQYVLMIFCGLIPFVGFSDALSTGVSSVVGNKGLIKNTLFPIELIPVKAVLTGSVTMLCGLVMLMVSLWLQGIVHATQLFIPVLILLQLIFSIGLIWLLSAVNVFVPDLSQIVGILILFLMLISPIAYTREMIPERLAPFMYPNPLFYLILLYRGAAYQGVIDGQLLLAFTAISVSTFWFGGFVFGRLKPLFADHV